ncbi:MAG: hypothetical protein A2W61_00040 [Deltaproteobacteria bacterium RIFCSPLOWO2_01_44_7]|nr:MAG: hypothetical protein A2712_00920 [Deltaproteobacteria bacterium RIFCSPHIGHO2_01_FULL_43_49]OGQ15299.1 MAG: hypothetical protein A3D22_04555 [Deltaproteobacteria bacterium RIFCSPHIGHO2_02_FULL_44_53]OGQ27077.1 MAG: hypothetical protein A3D98_01510 [Deltaproteobacteria bacterium RIFCSPHIGHO2_12_FULL_44_21]OGQ31815.1 MAG: hypothetical protein A2979_05715 [Deltaproteobacteria bacterium RIFCSPLOWO2_01_FULL_45_74]OGQ37629.1 MAG: hypothetical protein A2W61_00040 [Deltaproteobacteria bacterium 
MKKQNRQKKKGFDKTFDKGEAAVDFSEGALTEGLSKVVKLPPMTIPSWLALEIEKISKTQANSRAAVIRQLLVEAIRAKKHAA